MVVKLLIDSLCGGVMVFVYYLDKDWLVCLWLLELDCGGSVG